MVKLSPAEKKRWVEEMPVLAAIKRTPDLECGDFVRATEFGDLYINMNEKGSFYTLVRKPRG